MSNWTRQKNKRYIEKWDQTGSTEILDRGETSETPSLPLGGGGGVTEVAATLMRSPQEHKPEVRTWLLRYWSH